MEMIFPYSLLRTSKSSLEGFGGLGYQVVFCERLGHDLRFRVQECDLLR